MVLANTILLSPECRNHSDTAPASAGNAHSALLTILEQRNLSAVFQPILDLSGEGFIGFEGLIRGPADSPLHSHADLFWVARQCGLSLEIEMLCSQIVLEAFTQQKLPGRLFLNISPSVLTHPSFKDGQTLEYMRQLGITPDQVTIEITESQRTDDIKLMRDALLHYRSMGFKVAMDDLGEGFSSLRLWSELHPEYVKIDKHFVKDADSDPLKRQFLKSFQQIADCSGCLIIAEGIETEAELLTIKSLGIALGQGYFIARPSASPPLIAPPDTSYSVCCLPDKPSSNSRNFTAQKLLMQSADWERRCDKALQAFAHADDSHRCSGGYESEKRQGRPVFHPLPALSIGASHIEPGRFRSHIDVADVASEAKKKWPRVCTATAFLSSGASNMKPCNRQLPAQDLIRGSLDTGAR